MTHKHRTITLFCSIVMIAALFVACSSNSSSVISSTTSISTVSTVPFLSNMVIVQVESFEGSVVTAVVGELSEDQGDAPDGEKPPEIPSGVTSIGEEGGVPPDGMGGEAQGSGDGPPEVPSNNMDASGQLPDGEPPEGGTPGRQGSGMQFVAGNETITFGITAATAITMQDGQDGTIDSIAVGTVLEVTLDNNGDAAVITVRSMMAG